ncbi:MAG: ferredoxin [bacterium]|jgi:ferredoxin
MADWSLRFEDNVPGRFYVDEECIDCSLCSEIAPENFSVNLREGHDFVSCQPRNAREEELCKEAQESCPVEAIGSDGPLRGGASASGAFVFFDKSVQQGMV